MVLDKYFGFLNLQDEFTVIESFLDHTRIDEEEIVLLNDMIQAMCAGDPQKIEDIYLKIRKINADSTRMFETIADQVISANFDHRKQYDLLRIHQRIESISGLIIATAKRILIFYRIGATLPETMFEKLIELGDLTLKIHRSYTSVFTTYLDDKKLVIKHIHEVESQENFIDHVRSECLEILYLTANNNSIPMGTFMVIQEIVEHLEDISDAIENTATSIEWLLLS